MKNNQPQLELETKVFNSELFEPISDYQSSQLVGGMFTIQLVDLGAIPEPDNTDGGVETARANPTAILIQNGTDLNLNYGYVGDEFESVDLAAGQTKEHFTGTDLASAGWDKDLRLRDTQLDMSLLTPGNVYEFQRV